MISITGRKDFPILYGLDKTQAESLKGEGFSIRDMRNDWDYVYLVKDLIDLPGERYYSKRKNINKCIYEFRPEYKPISKTIIEQCKELQTSWCNLRECDSIPELKAENEAIKETFLHFSDLSVFGGVILVDGKVEAFTVGEKLNGDTAVVHFEKANPNVAGLYQVINQRFCSDALRGFKYVNREQDLGIAGLRQAKMSYHPTFLIEKFVATTS